MKTVKCITIGDRQVGKSAMLMSFIGNNKCKIPGEITFGLFNVYVQIVTINGKHIRLEITDTSDGDETRNHLRLLAYDGKIDVVLVCFSVTSPNTYNNIETKWIKELKEYCPQSKIILVGTKCDLRNSPPIIESLEMTNEKPLKYEDGIILAKKIGAFKYLECSAVTKVGLTEVLDAAASITSMKVIKKKKCPIL